MVAIYNKIGWEDSVFGVDDRFLVVEFCPRQTVQLEPRLELERNRKKATHRVVVILVQLAMPVMVHASFSANNDAIEDGESVFRSTRCVGEVVVCL